MVERLLLDGIHAEAARAAIGGEDDPVALAGANEAEAALALVERAVARAEVALDAAVAERVPVAPRVRHAWPPLERADIAFPLS